MKEKEPSRKKEFLETGARLAEKVGSDNVTRRAIAEAHKVSDPLVGKHVGGKDDLRAGIKRTMKRLGIKEPANAAELGKALRVRKKPTSAKKVVKKATRVKKSTSATSASRGAKATAGRGKVGNVTARKSNVNAKKPAAPAAPADPKKGAPSRKVVTKSPENKARFPTKMPPLPALPKLA